MSSDADADQTLVRRLCAGEPHALGELFSAQRERLRRMVQLRLDRRLQGRIDPSDVIQEAFLDAARRLAEYAADPAMSAVSLAPVPDRPAARHVAPRSPRGEGPRRRAGSFAPQRATPLGRLPVPGSPAPRPADDSRAGPRSGPRSRSRSRMRSTPWTRSTARSWPCGTLKS